MIFIEFSMKFDITICLLNRDPWHMNQHARLGFLYGQASTVGKIMSDNMFTLQLYVPSIRKERI